MPKSITPQIEEKPMVAKLVEAVEPVAFEETLKVCLYGKFGSRKSLQIGHLIDLVGADNVLVISAERGLGTIQSKLTNPQQVLAVSNLDELRAVYLTAKEFAEQDARRWVCVDGMSQVTEWLANAQLSGAEQYYDLKVQNQTIPAKLLPFGRFLSDKGAIDSMRVYGRVGRDSENLLSAWIGLPCNLYCNYLEDMTGSSGYEKTPPYGPDVPGRVGLRALMSSFDFVGRLSYDTDGNLVGQFDSRSNYYMARTREDRTKVDLPVEIGNFRLDKFVQLIKGELQLTQTT
jgi:hypothetical protein